MKKLILLVLVAAFTAACASAGGVKLPHHPTPDPLEYRAYAAVVETAFGQPLEGATVRFGSYVATTTAAGYGLVAKIPLGRYPVEISAIGCQSYNGEVELTSTTQDIVVRLDCAGRIPRLPTRSEVLNYRGCLANFRDSAGRVIWTPALPGAPAEIRREWLGILASNGCVHVPIGPFDAGPAYPGVEWDNPDWTTNPSAIRQLVVDILQTPSVRGHGMIPHVFLDGGGADPKPRLERFMPIAVAAISGLEDSVLTTPTGWEPVVGSWKSAEVSWALERWKAVAPSAIVGYHGSPTRLVGSSNPVEVDDPWQGAEAAFYTSYGGQYINIALYQTPHGAELYRDCDETLDSCWLNRWEDYVARIGAGLNGWRVLPIVLWETVAYELFNGHLIDGKPVTHEDAQRVAGYAKRICDKWKVQCGYGNGWPVEAGK